MDNYPIYKAVITDDAEEAAMFAISLVENPAVERDFLYFSAEKQLSFAVEDEEKHLVTGLVMCCDTPIFRLDCNMNPYYIVFDAETIKTMTRKFLKNGYNNNVDLEHDFNYIDGVELMELYIKDSARGISPKGFDDVKDGSLFGTYYIKDAEVWQQIKEGTFKGFSIEVSCGIEKMNKQNKTESKIMSKLQNLKTMLRQMLEVFGAISTDKGPLSYASDGELPEVGEAIFVVAEDGTENPAEDGEYTTEAGDVIVVADGVVAEIRIAENVPAEPEPEPEVIENAEPEQPAEPEPEQPVEDERDARIAELEARIAELEAENAELQARIDELENKPAAEPAEEEFKKITKVEKTGNSKLDRLARIMNA